MASGRPDDGELVFADPQGRPLDANGIVRYGWRRIRQAAEGPLPRVRDLRHA